MLWSPLLLLLILKSCWASLHNFKLKHILHRGYKNKGLFLKKDILNASSIYPLHAKPTLFTSSGSPRHPDEKDPKTVLTMAQMTANAYTEPDGKDWTPLDGWNISTPFGWSKDGIRGYVFTNEESNIMVITLKGTSPSWIGSGPTTPRDKFMDNLMFSCCCGAVDRTWTPICDCRTGQFECNNSCLKQNSNIADSYYNLAQSIYIAVRSMYPSSRLSIWMTGHSLGGSLASLIGMTNNVPTFAYEAPGDLLYATRIGLLGSFKPNTTEFYNLMQRLPIFHFGNDGDPIFLGTCTGTASTCYWSGYAMESQCHLGKTCLYRHSHELVVSNDYSLTAKVDIRYHGINYVIKQFLESATVVPECQVQKDCVDCEHWTFNA